ncbi:hypothetical protein S245_016216, partial [Arachis hypogaea]
PGEPPASVAKLCSTVASAIFVPPISAALPLDKNLLWSSFYLLDIANFVHHKVQSPPILNAHSFGVLIIQYYISSLGSNNPEGAILVCSVPPSGNSGLVWRYLFTKPIAAFKVTCSLAVIAFQTSLPLCRETFFSATMEDHIVKRYQELMKESSRLSFFDLRKLNASLPVPSAPNCPVNVLVLGAKNDFIV